MNVTAHIKVGDRGWYPEAISFPAPEQTLTAGDFTLTLQTGGGERPCAIRELRRQGDEIFLYPDFFRYDTPFLLRGPGICLATKDVTDLQVAGLDRFEAAREGEVLYRLYRPAAKGPRPLLLFLHGGGECGSDNLQQMVGSFGAIQLAELYPDMYVLAPQAPGDLAALVAAHPQSLYNQSFSTFREPDGIGWGRSYLARVCELIRQMIRDGLVDENRVYVVGLSMGGGGALRALSVGCGLFAAAVPICPSMTPETFAILRSLTRAKLWIAAAYADHRLYRTKYIVDGVLALRDAGSRSVHLTLFSPEELAAYGFGADPDLTLEQKLMENHSAWSLVFHGEHGILDWLVSQRKDEPPTP